MPATFNRPDELGSTSAQLAKRNQELLQFRDSALNLAYRIVGNAADAEDVLQDAYLRAVRVSTPILGGSELRNWFFQITANAGRDWLRSERSRHSRERIAAMETDQLALPAHSDQDRADLKAQVDAEFSRLDEKLRLPLTLHYEHGMSYEDAAVVLGLTPGTLRVYASQGLKELREKLDVPRRPVTAEVLIALLGAGFVLKASPALAASVEGIVATAPEIALAKAAPGKPVVYGAATKSGSGLLIGVAAFAALMLIGVTGYLSNTYEFRQPIPPPQPPTEIVIPTKVPIQVAPEVVPAIDPPFPAFVNPPVAAAPENVRVVTDYKPDAAFEANWVNADDLIPHLDPARDVVTGNWSLNGKTLLGTPGNFSRLGIPYVPAEEYDLRVDFTRSAGGADINLMFPAAGSGRVWKIDSWKACFFGIHKGNPDTKPVQVANDVRHTAVVEVRRDTLTSYLDGQVMNRIEIAKAYSAVAQDWRLPDSRMIGLGSWRNSLAVHCIAVRSVTGKGALLPTDTDAANAVSETYWKDAIDLMPRAVAKPNAPAGVWKLANGRLEINAVHNARYQLDYAPPAEYDFRVDFTRLGGTSDVAQIVAAGGHQFVWKMDINGICIFDMIGGQNRDDNPTTTQTPAIVINGHEHSSVICVRKDGIKAYVDGRLIISYTTNFSDMGIEGTWRLPNPNAIGVGFHVSPGSFSRIQIKEISGEGKALEPAKNTVEKEGF